MSASDKRAHLTPRTDAAVCNKMSPGSELVPAHFARQLERELAEANETIGTLRIAAEHLEREYVSACASAAITPGEANNPLLSSLRWIVEQENYTFAECSLAEEIMHRAKIAYAAARQLCSPVKHVGASLVGQLRIVAESYASGDPDLSALLTLAGERIEELQRAPSSELTNAAPQMPGSGASTGQAGSEDPGSSVPSSTVSDCGNRNPAIDTSAVLPSVSHERRGDLAQRLRHIAESLDSFDVKIPSLPWPKSAQACREAADTMLYEYVMEHAVRGACQCGKCADAPADPANHQPSGHTADLMFFKVAAKDASADEFKQLVQAEFPHWLDGKEHSYLEAGGDIGDQGAALMAMGLGSVLGTWKLLTPRTVLGKFVDDAMAMQMAGMGMISIQA